MPTPLRRRSILAAGAAGALAACSAKNAPEASESSVASASPDGHGGSIRAAGVTDSGRIPLPECPGDAHAPGGAADASPRQR